MEGLQRDLRQARPYYLSHASTHAFEATWLCGGCNHLYASSLPPTSALLTLYLVDLQTCGKSFKRPQDLRKHEKIHTEDHHIRHKQSKAITIPGSGANPNPAAAVAASLAVATTNEGKPLPPNFYQQQQNGNGYQQHQKPQQTHLGLHGYAQQQQQFQHVVESLSNSAEASPAQQPSVLNSSSAASNALAAAAPSLTPAGFFPYMLPYPFPYAAAAPGMPTVEQQAGLAELLLQQQRLNAAAAQLMGMPSQNGNTSNNPLTQGLHSAPGSSGSSTSSQHQQFGNPAANPYSMMFPGLLSALSGAQAQQSQQQFQPFGTSSNGFMNNAQQQQQSATSFHHHAHQQQQVNEKSGSSAHSSSSLYPNLSEMMRGNENQPPSQVFLNSNGKIHHSRSDSSTGESPASSHAYHSVSPQPGAYNNSHRGSAQYDQMQKQQQAYHSMHHQYAAAAQQQQDLHIGRHVKQENTNSSQPYGDNLHSGNHSSRSSVAGGVGNIALGKGKRSFEAEADALLNDLKKKRFDGGDRLDCKSAWCLMLRAQIFPDF